MKFSDQVAKWAGDKAIPMATAIVKKSAEKLAEEANLQGPSVANPAGGKGGHLPVDTSFLINSLYASIGTVPSGPSVKPKGFTSVDWDSAQVTVVINGMELGDTLYLGWTAEYAPFMENRYGFARLATQNWQNIVSETTLEARAAFNAK